MSNNRVTPFIKRMRTNGGTIYTFSSALEDIGLNINERNNVVKISHFALLDIPRIRMQNNDNTEENYFNLFGIPGAWEYEQSSADKDGRSLIAESFQNYVLNFEANLLNQDTYNPSLQRTVTERVFWKWLKETGAIRWEKLGDYNNKPYFKEEIDVSQGVGYEKVVKYIGKVSAGNMRTDKFGTYNETYVLVPTSHGQTNVYFEQFEDDNYRHNIEIGDLGENILGREGFVNEHPDGLSFKAYYDYVDQPDHVGSYVMQYKDTNGIWQDGWWYTAENSNPISARNAYKVDTDEYLINNEYNVDLKYTDGTTDFIFKRSKVDCISLVFEEETIKPLLSEDGYAPEDLIDFNYDKLAINLAINDNFNFNAVLIYYTIYNSTMDTVLGRNLLGILFLDAPEGNKSEIDDDGIVIPSLEKIQSTASGFGTSYSLRLNIKTDNMLDVTDTSIYVDESTSDQLYAEDWDEAFYQLNNAINILTRNNSTIQYISDQYTEIKGNQTQIINDIQQIQWDLNKKVKINPGTEFTVPIFATPDSQNLVMDSSIVQKNGFIGIFNSNPLFPLHIDAPTTKVKDIILEKKIYDTSGNILLGYGSPMQIGSSTNRREVAIYTGDDHPVFFADTSNNINIKATTIFKENIVFESSLNIFKDNIQIIDDSSSILEIDSKKNPNHGFIFSHEVDISGNIQPTISNQFNLGSTANYYKTLYINPDDKSSETQVLFWNNSSKKITKGTLSTFTNSTAGLVPAPGTANGKVLSDDGTWIDMLSGDITAVNAGTGLNGGGTSGSVTIKHRNTSGWYHIPTGGQAGQILGWSADGKATWINANPGDITGVTAGTGLSGGGTSGTVTLNHASGDGWKHIPSGGQSGKILGWSSNGTATWIDAPNTGISNVSASAPLSGNISSQTLNLSIAKADSTHDGYLSKGDWSAFNSKTSNTGTITQINTTGPLSGGPITSTGTISITKADSTHDGYLSKGDWTAFHNKGNGTVTSIATSGSITGGTITSSGTISHSTAAGHKHIPAGGSSGQVLAYDSPGTAKWVSMSTGGGTVTQINTTGPLSGGPITDTGTISITKADSTHDGYLSKGDWSTFYNKTSNTGTVTHVSTSAPLSGDFTTSGTISITKADSTHDGYLSKGDWTAFNNKTSNTGTVTSVATSGAITGGTITSTGTISHSTSAGYKHIPTGGSSNQWLKYSSSGTATWASLPISSAAGSTPISTSVSSGKLTVSHSTSAGYKHIPTGGAANQWLKYSSSGTAVWSGLPVASISNNTNNRILTATGNSAINGEANLTFDGTDLVNSNGKIKAKTQFLGTNNGSASSPTYSWASDTNTGMFFTGTQARIGFSTDGVERFRMDNGHFHADGEITAYSTAMSSDIRLKENVKKLDSKDSLEKVLLLNGVTFDFIEKSKGHSGFIAQDVEQILPDIVKEEELLGKEGKYKTVKYTEIIPYLTESIKEMKSIIDNQNDVINTLKKEIEEIKNKLN